MGGRHPRSVVEGALPAGYRWGALPEIDGLTTTGLAVFIDRGLSLASLVALMPALDIGIEHAPFIDRTWLLIVGGALVAAGGLMPIYAWSRRGIRPLAALYAVATLLGLLTWPLAWTGPGAASYMPPLLVPVGLGVVCAGVAWSTGIAIGYGGVAAVVTFLVCLTPAGGANSPAVALQDAGLTVVQTLATLFVLRRLRNVVAA
jgi:hypothetical protein